MGLTSSVITMVDEVDLVMKTIAAMCSECEPARELVIINLKNTNLQKFIKSKYAIPVLLSLSRSAKILKRIICD